MKLYDDICGEFTLSEMSDFAKTEQQIRARCIAGNVLDDGVDKPIAHSGIGFAGTRLAATYLDTPWQPQIVPLGVIAPKHDFVWRGQRVEVKTRSQSSYRHFVTKDNDPSEWDILICASPIAAKAYLDYALIGWINRDEYFEQRGRRDDYPGWWLGDWQLHPMKSIWRYYNDQSLLA